MNQIVTTGIILSRTDYGEADRIISVLTPDKGKLSLMAKGTRKVKSKLAGGIELFSVSDITYIRGKGEMGSLISSRLLEHYGKIIQDIERVQLGYSLIKMLNRATEDHTEKSYFDLLQHALEALNDSKISGELVLYWFESQLLRLSGHTPNLRADAAGNRLSLDEMYNFDFDSMTFVRHEKGSFDPSHIKTLRLLFSEHLPKDINNVQNLVPKLTDIAPLISASLHTYIRV